MLSQKMRPSRTSKRAASAPQSSRAQCSPAPRGWLTRLSSTMSTPSFSIGRPLVSSRTMGHLPRMRRQDQRNESARMWEKGGVQCGMESERLQGAVEAEGLVVVAADRALCVAVRDHLQHDPLRQLLQRREPLRRAARICQRRLVERPADVQETVEVEQVCAADKARDQGMGTIAI